MAGEIYVSNSRPGRGCWETAQWTTYSVSLITGVQLPRAHLNTLAKEQVSVITGHLCSGMGDRGRGIT